MPFSPASLDGTGRFKRHRHVVVLLMRSSATEVWLNVRCFYAANAGAISA